MRKSLSGGAAGGAWRAPLHRHRWLVIVAAEMLTGGLGIGFWIWNRVEQPQCGKHHHRHRHYRRRRPAAGAGPDAARSPLCSWQEK